MSREEFSSSQREYWRRAIDECEHRPAGMSVNDWCEKNGVSRNKLYHYRGMMLDSRPSGSQNSGSFVDITQVLDKPESIKPDQTLREPVPITIQQNDLKISFDDRIREDTLLLILRSLQNA